MKQWIVSFLAALIGWKRYATSAMVVLVGMFISTSVFGQPKGQPKDEPPVCDPAVICHKDEEPKPPPKPFILMCGEGTTRPGQSPLGLHCECADPTRTTLVTGKLDYGGKEEKCVPNKDVIDSLYALYLQLETDKANTKDVYTKAEIDKMLAEIKEMIRNLPTRVEFVALVERVTILEGRMDKVEKRVDRLSDSIVSIFAGIGGEYTLRGPDPAGGDVHGVVNVTGNITDTVGIYGEVEGGFQGARDTGTGFEVGGGAGVSFTLTDFVRLQLGGAFRQFGRTHADENDVIGNGTSYAIGGQARLIGNVADAFAISPYIGVGGGEVAGFKGGDKSSFYREAGATFWLGLDLMLSTGIGTR